ncbi:MAG: DUF3489 domain-containing protein [Sphingobium sp.]|nr:DUF3489 domain-containing protein [Sphingobium sp.]
MTEQIEQILSEPRAAPANRATKSAAVQKLLARNKGATLAEIMTATHWQPHSARAFLTGLRKKGIVLLRETRSSGDTNWRIEG